MAINLGAQGQSFGTQGQLFGAYGRSFGAEGQSFGADGKSCIRSTFLLIVLIALIALIAGCSPDTGSAEVFFCPEENCGDVFADAILSANQSVECAFYSLNLDIIKDALYSRKDIAKVVLDHGKLDGLNFRYKKYSRGLMHNKFCVIDSSVVVTGSFNPGTNYRDNVIVIISPKISRAYLAEFDELWNGNFGSGKKGSVKLNLEASSVEALFCPEDKCGSRLYSELSSAESSVYFLVFSFTDNNIANALLEKSDSIPVRGILENSQNSKWSVYPLIEKKADVRLFTKGTLHNKIFIIDNSTVITGSYNPTKNGDENNDENMLVIKDSAVAMEYADYFSRIYQES